MEQSGSYRRSQGRNQKAGNRRGKKNWDHRNPGDKRKQRREEHPRPRAWFNKEIAENLQRSSVENAKAINDFKQQTKPLCARCGGEIENIAEALCDRQTGEPMHFDCVVTLLQEQEPLGQDERIVYIGRGRFGVAKQGYSRSPVISRIIEWENEKTSAAPWRKEISALYSQVQ